MGEKTSNKRGIITIIVSVVIIVIVIEKVLLWRSYAKRAEERRSPAMGVTTNDSVEVRMRAAAMVAIATVEPSSRDSFNFSPESLEQVDKMLAQLPLQVSETNRNEELYYGCIVWGAYLGEVFRQQYPTATWSENEEVADGKVFALQIGTEIIYPCQWAIDRLEQGESANVWKRYQSLSPKR